MDSKTEVLKKSKNEKEYISDNGIRVKVIYPDNVPEAVKQQKINCIYDILTRHKSA